MKPKELNQQDFSLLTDRDVVLYVRFPIDVTDKQVHHISETMYNFCDMLGAKVIDHFWEVSDDWRHQPKLTKALHRMNDTKYGELVTFDLSSLTPDVERSLQLSEQILSDGGFVYFVDSESVQMECQMIMNYNRKDDVRN